MLHRVRRGDLPGLGYVCWSDDVASSRLLGRWEAEREQSRKKEKMPWNEQVSKRRESTLKSSLRMSTLEVSQVEGEQQSARAVMCDGVASTGRRNETLAGQE